MNREIPDFMWQDLGPDQQQQQGLGNHNNMNPNNINVGVHPFIEVVNHANHGINDDGLLWNIAPMNNTLDGGSAVEGKPSTQCDMSVYLIFTGSAAPLGVASNHPVFTPGSTVEIFLDRSINLSTLFQRYCTFANACPNSFITPKKTDPSLTENNESSSSVLVEPSDLEFHHCFILDPCQTVDLSALMHKDKIRVRAYQQDERKHQIERLKLQQEIDKNYFDQLRLLMPDLTPSFVKCDVLFHCTGRITDDKGLKQEVLNTHVKGNAALVAKRCSWLKMKIALAKLLFHHQQQQQQQQLLQASKGPKNGLVVPQRFDDNPMEEGNLISVGVGSKVEDTNQVEDKEFSLVQEDKVDEPNAALNRNEEQQFHDQNIVVDEETNTSINATGSDVWHNHVDPLDRQVNDNRLPPSASAHAVEDDEEDPHGSIIASSTMGFGDSNQHQAAIVTLNHPPEAVKLLLEYCYTNRVISLGYEAYVQSFKPLDPVTTDPIIEKYGGIVNPFHPNTPSSWPNHGLPTISLPIALAGIQLSEEALIPRLSLMCEIAASNLVTTTSALDVLGFCEIQQGRSGNRLNILRKAVMINHIFMDGPKGVLHLSNSYSLYRTLRDKKDTVVPGLFSGVKDVLQEVLGPKIQPIGDPQHDIRERKALLLSTVKHHFDQIDQEDRKLRNRERKGSRKEKRMRRSVCLLSEDDTDEGRMKVITNEVDQFDADM